MKEVRARGRYSIAGSVAALVLLLAWGTPADGQVTAAPQQDLSFGMLTPGVAATVLADDVARRAEWLLTGRGNVTMSFVLPTVLQGPAGAVIPLVFAAGDAAWERDRGGGGPRLEDPNAPFTVNVPNRRTVRLYLGGTAQPAPTQAAGLYVATVTVVIAQP